MNLSTVAVPHTLTHLKPLLPPAPARILEAGCGRGALAAALADLGYEVTGVDRDAAAATAAKELGVNVLHADLRDVSGEYDVVLFTRSLHHAENLDELLAHAAPCWLRAGRSSSRSSPGSAWTPPPRTSSTTTAPCWSQPA